MRAFALQGEELRLGLADVGGELREAVAALGFARQGALFVRSLAADGPYAGEAAARFELCAERMVRQAAGLEPVPWASTLETVLERAGTTGWWLAGSAALAVRGLEVEPRDLDLISDAGGCERLGALLSDLLVEPIVDGAWLGERWFRAFGDCRIECVGGVHPSHDDPEPCDFGPAAAARAEAVRWRDWELRVPPLELQLRACERRGLDARATAIRDALR